MDKGLEYQQEMYKKILAVRSKKEEDWMKLSGYLVSNGEVFDAEDQGVFMSLTLWNLRIFIKKFTVCFGVPFYFHKFGLPDTPNKMLKALGITYLAIPFFFKTLEEQYYVEQIQQILIYKYKNLECFKAQ